MKNQVQFSAFTFKSNSVRVITDNNQEPWFCANDVCDILGYSNPRDAILKHCKAGGSSETRHPYQKCSARNDIHQRTESLPPNHQIS